MVAVFVFVPVVRVSLVVGGGLTVGACRVRGIFRVLAIRVCGRRLGGGVVLVGVRVRHVRFKPNTGILGVRLVVNDGQLVDHTECRADFPFGVAVVGGECSEVSEWDRVPVIEAQSSAGFDEETRPVDAGVVIAPSHTPHLRAGSKAVACGALSWDCK